MNSDSTVFKPKEKIIMQTNVAQLLKAPVGSIRTLPVDDNLEDNGTVYHVKGEVALIRTNNSILVQGTTGHANQNHLQPLSETFYA